ncbi:hypothetical protein THASP1DRAFT_32687 [Thamnocephalis sphaerospora]|uniref:Uncharacterized protein n=1 Tax=Thamnocephalis sphaerospora TaxID=78915 RepID=A0A4P9XIF2_9FUNG|nr:hypothetical protein THASP1DRAFT_32687 [Thamnocephalis sphaerospora]|eukprot:RKP05473.1 hypothetical protein THASP1DRAFT_32687 [Thamnocephalis sphaerospora]
MRRWFVVLACFLSLLMATVTLAAPADTEGSLVSLARHGLYTRLIHDEPAKKKTAASPSATWRQALDQLVQEKKDTGRVSLANANKAENALDALVAAHSQPGQGDAAIVDQLRDHGRRDATESVLARIYSKLKTIEAEAEAPQSSSGPRPSP